MGAMSASPPGLDLTRLRDYLDRERPGLLDGSLAAELIAGGRSNLTYTVTNGTRTVVLRRPPLGHVLATAHDMGREFQVIGALADTGVPVPAVFLHCADADVLGAPFYLMSNAPGTPYRQAADLAAIGPDRTRDLTTRMVDTLADLHAIDPHDVGLAEFGRPAGFATRQVRRWKKQLDASHCREVEGFDQLYERLAAAVPEIDTDTAGAWAGIVHGDYRLDNLLVDEDDRITAVLDWEMATLGDTRSDVALLIAYGRLGRQSSADAISDASAAPGFIGDDAAVARYEIRRGAELADLHVHLGLAYFKLAVILEGIHYRYTYGQTVGSGFERVGDLVPGLVRLGLDVLE